jgi:hypothetical protein
MNGKLIFLLIDENAAMKVDQDQKNKKSLYEGSI